LEFIKILIVDEQALNRESLNIILNLEKDMKVVGVAQDGLEAIFLCKELLPDVVLMDTHLPNMDGITASLKIKAAWPKTKIIIRVEEPATSNVLQALENGAEGYLLKSTHPRHLANSIRIVYSGGTLVTKEMASNLLSQTQKNRQGSRPPKGKRQKKVDLSNQEELILQLLSKGFKDREIAEGLFITNGKLKTIISAIFAKIEGKGKINTMM
jgi:DNA-binding NarL/FixJ family response regulator